MGGGLVGTLAPAPDGAMSQPLLPVLEQEPDAPLPEPELQMRPQKATKKQRLAADSGDKEIRAR